MSTLSQVFANVVAGSFTTSVALILFGSAVRFGWNSNLTPRAWSRPKAILKNCLDGPFYGISWITWAMRQQYSDLLAGIPGTGTRKDGWSGPTLKANLDAVIQIRVQVLQFKVSVVATVLMVVLLLPLYYTTACDPLMLGLQTCLNQMNLTDFEQLTIANVPPYSFSPLLNGTTAIQINGSSVVLMDGRDNPLSGRVWVPGLSSRYVAPVFTMIVITIFTCYLLWYEWVECLALRRVYYLESEYFLERMEELDALKLNQDPEDPFQESRPPFLPHPEMRETIPNVSLNSVLFQLPYSLKEYRGRNGKDDGKSLLERQLDATVNFFDKCIPNQPGFTSSVVAVTIVPDAKLVKGAWMKWYNCGKKLRRLRYIMHVLEKRKKMQADGVLGVHDYVDTALKAPKQVVKATSKAAGQVAKATGKAMAKATDRVCATDFSNESNGQQSHDSTKDANEKPMETDPKGSMVVGESEIRDEDEKNETEPSHDSAKDANEQPMETDPKASMAVRESEIRDKNEKSETDHATETLLTMNDVDGKSSALHDYSKKNPDGENDNWFGRLATTFRLGRNEGSSRESEQDSGTKNVEASVHCDAQSEPGFQISTAASQFESDGFFDAKSSKIETEISKSPNRKNTQEHFEYHNFDPEEFAKWIGYTEETTCDEILETLGVEQLTVYSREMSQSASNPCVNGCNEEALAFWSIEELEDQLQDAWEDVREANAKLLRVRADIFRKENKILRKSEVADDVEVGIEERNVKNNLLSVDEGGDQDSHPVNMESGFVSHSSSERSGSLRQRAVPSAHLKYKMAQSLVNQMNNISSTIATKRKKDARCCKKTNFVCFAQGGPPKVTKVLDHPSFAIVTFTSRQAAIAARQCLADGKGIDRWDQVDAIPIPPLADAPPCDIFFCRGCCRPVTLTINPKERKVREIFVWTFYFFFCCLYAIPLALTSAVLNPDYLAAAFPDSPALHNPNGIFYRLLAGISSGMLYSLFFSVLPQIFKYLAFMLGSASTVAKGEDNALRFYWYFMLVTAFTGSTLATMLIDGLMSGNVGSQFKTALTSIARTIPTSQAPVWMNWIVTRTFITLPMNYLFQLMTFVYGSIRFKWLNRVMRGGGPGGPPPYRINVDSGVVFMCITSIAPAAPLIAPFATLYYMIFIPMLRWLHIFVYRPKYDAGGARFPIYHEQIISSLILGQILTAASLLLKQGIVAGFTVFALMFPTLFFSEWTKEQFYRSYMDAGLLQTSQLDGWGVGKTMEGREKYRRWLVDCHKASYVPICLSGGEDFLTSQPAVAVPTHRDLAEYAHEEEEEDTFVDARMGTKPTSSRPSLKRWKQQSERLIRNSPQKGAVFDRYLES
ncbi:protein of unknown function DUF221-domain containing protein [Nitzschia inconspicua]|uniref:CSC1/OSCA1-like 7TM region domain-containing protein n=1 Tax=Nitzschia inconspicua TaxID=303405 RepID=A0A9K3PRU7_9STRA|nr:protein of unknown function DUF221-domain containing protein [Nitzschia inconspicua]